MFVIFSTDSSVMPVPVNITQVQTLTRQVTIQWEVCITYMYVILNGNMHQKVVKGFNNSLCSIRRNTHSSKLILGVALVT